MDRERIWRSAEKIWRSTETICREDRCGEESKRITTENQRNRLPKARRLKIASKHLNLKTNFPFFESNSNQASSKIGCCLCGLASDGSKRVRNVVRDTPAVLSIWRNRLRSSNGPNNSAPNSVERLVSEQSWRIGPEMKHTDTRRFVWVQFNV